MQSCHHEVVGSPGPSLLGRSLGGRYDVLELLGVGGMGAVYRVLDRELDEVVALKVILTELAGDARAIEQFRNEVRLARRVTHRNVARTFELGHADGMWFCTMELVDGESLRAWMQRRGRLPIEEAITIASALCDGLAAAHAAGVIHRDVKPENVFIDRHGRAVLGDFGVATVSVGDGSVAGTPAYMAPEHLAKQPPAPAADVYSVGIVLHELLTGTNAFEGTPLEIYEAKTEREHVVTPDVPSALATVIARATARDVGARFTSALALRDALAPWAARDSVVTIERVPRAFDDVRSVAVRPPTAPQGTMHLAQAVFAELLQRLARIPRLHVHGARDATPPAVTVELAATDDLAIAVTGPRAPLQLRVPLSLEHVAFAAQTAVDAVVAALADDDPLAEARELVLRARVLAHSGLARASAAVEMLEEAAILAPADPQIAAHLANAKLVRLFWAPSEDNAMLERATELVHFAVANAPDSHETLLAAGQLALHTADPTTAARHFRAAIARAPYDASAHEQLGRMLLEAGHFEQGLERFDDAVALSTHRRSTMWEIARVRALEARWDQFDQLVAELSASGQDSLLGELRFTCWRGVDYARSLRGRYAHEQVWEPEVFDGLFATICDGAWLTVRDGLVAYALESGRPSSRRRSAIRQVVAETACIGGDGETAELLVVQAIESGMFDLPWLDRCPVLGPVRERPGFPALRARVTARADAILDALYGDVNTVQL